MPEPKILIFAFEEFDMPGHLNRVNISEIVAEHIDVDSIRSDNIEVVVLPVDLIKIENNLTEIRKIFEEKVSQFNPDYIIGMGEINTMEDDNDIFVELKANPISERSEELRHKTLVDFKQIASDAGVMYTPDESTESNYHGDNERTEIHLSEDPGYFQCNYLYYLSLEYMKKQGKEGNALFLHYEDSIGHRLLSAEELLVLDKLDYTPESFQKTGLDRDIISNVYHAIWAATNDLSGTPGGTAFLYPN